MTCVTSEIVGKAPTGDNLKLITLSHPSGVRVSMLNWGAALTSLEVPDQRGKLTDIVLGLSSYSDYLTSNPFYIGTAVGRTAGRISPAEVSIAGRKHALTQNEGAKHLHGGVEGLHNRCWRVVVPDPECPSIRLETELPDEMEGYPGAVAVSLTCDWQSSNTLVLEYRARTDRTTLFNPTRHEYFNLGGHDSGQIGAHVVCLPHSRYLPVDEQFVENLPPREVAQTPIDFRQPKPLGDPLITMERHLRGINYAFLNEHTSMSQPAAQVRHPSTGIDLTFFTNQNTLQFYTGNFLDDSIPAKDGARYGPASWILPGSVELRQWDSSSSLGQGLPIGTRRRIRTYRHLPVCQLLRR